MNIYYYLLLLLDNEIVSVVEIHPQENKSSLNLHIAVVVNALRLRQNGCHIADNLFKIIFLNENVQILIKISLKSVPKGPINSIPALFQILAWRRPGDKPLSEPILFNLLTHASLTSMSSHHAYWCHGSARSQGISSCGVDPVCKDYPHHCLGKV